MIQGLPRTELCSGTGHFIFKTKFSCYNIAMKYSLSIIIIFGLLSVLPASAQSIENVDTDGDGLTNIQEIDIYHTNPRNIDTDGDGFNDNVEIENNYSPLQAKKTLSEVDSDNDGLSDAWEIKLGSNLMSMDSDNDTFSDGQEFDKGFSPTSAKNIAVEKKITVDIKGFNTKYYFGDVLLESIKVSTGLKSWPTPTGTFKVLDKVPSKNYGGGPYSFYYPDTKWNLHFVNKNNLRYFIHGAYWHDEFGKKNVSSGCVNVAYKDMEPLYKFASVGTKIVIK